MDQRVDAYVAGRMSETEEAEFCEELMRSPDLQRQVVEAGILARALHAVDQDNGHANPRTTRAKLSNGPA